MVVTKGKVIKDLFLNIIGSFIVTATLQLMVYPFMSYKMSTASFGNILTLMGISNTITSIFGNSLNNIRLVKQEYYEENEFSDFRIIINRIIVITIISMMLVAVLFRNQITIIEAIFLIIATVFLMLRSYMNVYYRIKLDYNKIIIHLIFTAFGYLIGLLIFNYVKVWSIVFCVGEVSAFIYAYKTTNFKLEENIRSKNFKEVSSDFIQLSSSNCISSLLLYLDRILINPILGPSNVAIYYIASVVGKTVGIIFNPLSSIILTYLAKMKNTSMKKIFYLLSFTSIIMGSVVYLISIPITPIIIKILYPGQLSVVQPYFELANLSVILMICGALINPILLKSAPMWWQNVIQGIYCMLYLGLSVLLMIKWNLYGFCIAGIIANSIKFIMMEIVGYYYSKS
ncbi:hypothetical protein [uncultured Clostridium sp.]|uniref:lipopolysaccharide biosynthesis protein n=1 Tax=uncultured Clostridium sp. TaxID=59620 RepID=UPI0032180E66